MMSSSSSGRSCSSRFPFTASQWQQLEHQALVFKYMVCGMPIPPDLLFTIRTSFDSSLPSSNFSIGWNSNSSSFQMGFGRKIDPEPGRCRRTDGKKWRCSKDAYPDSKYCERHMHRGRNRSRKPVETTNAPPTQNAIPTTTSFNNTKTQPHFLYPHDFSSSRVAPVLALSSHQTTNNFFLESGHAHSLAPPKDFRNSSYAHGGGYSSDLLSGQKILNDHNNFMQQQKHENYNNLERDEQPKKVMHHFLDECPPKDKHSWSNSEDKMPNHRTQLSISIPNSLHDFFITQKW